VEDAWLYSKNIVRQGWKLWLLFRPQDKSKIEAKLAELLEIPDIPNSDFIRDHALFIAPELFRRWNIEYKIQLQGPGDMIVTYPGAYHQVLNITDTLAEAINFAPVGWKLARDHKFKKGVPKALRAEDFTYLTPQPGINTKLSAGKKRKVVDRAQDNPSSLLLEKRLKEYTAVQLPTPPPTVNIINSKKSSRSVPVVVSPSTPRRLFKNLQNNAPKATNSARDTSDVNGNHVRQISPASDCGTSTTGARECSSSVDDTMDLTTPDEDIERSDDISQNQHDEIESPESTIKPDAINISAPCNLNKAKSRNGKVHGDRVHGPPSQDANEVEGEL